MGDQKDGTDGAEPMDVSDKSKGKEQSIYVNDPELEDKIAAVTAADKPLEEVIEALLSLERVNRLAAAAPETARICVAVIEACFDRKDWSAVVENVTLLSKRRSQVKLAVTKMVQKAMEYVLVTPDEPTKLRLLSTLRDVTAGKIYVELEGARLTKTLAEMREKNGDFVGAADIMQELQVETFGTMDRREKTDFILEQVRLCLKKGDFIRAAIICKKITSRALSDKTLGDLKLRYYALMVRIHVQTEDYGEICRAWLARYDTPSILEDKDKWETELKLAIIFLTCTPQDSMQRDLLHRVAGYKNTKSLPIYASFLRLFTTNEIIRWAMVKDQYAAEFGKELKSVVELEVDGKALDWMSELHDRVTEHNIKVVSLYFTRIRLARLAELLELNETECEERLTRQVADRKALWAKIDRPGGIVAFTKPQDPNEALNTWTETLTLLLDTVDKTCQLANKEVRSAYKRDMAAESQE